jgi:hypothetical protein
MHVVRLFKRAMRTLKERPAEFELEEVNEDLFSTTSG